MNTKTLRQIFTLVASAAFLTLTIEAQDCWNVVLPEYVCNNVTYELSCPCDCGNYDISCTDSGPSGTCTECLE